MKFYKRFPSDYAGDTGDLSLAEHGAYTVMLDHYYANDGALPTELQALYRLCRAVNQAEKKAVENVAQRFFAINGDGRRHNYRADREIGIAIDKSSKAKESADRRWKHAKDDANASKNEVRMACERIGSSNASQKPEPEEAKASGEGKAPSPEVRGEAASAPSCPHEKVVELYHATLPTCTRVVEWNTTRQGLLRARWREKSIAKGKHPGYATEEAGLAFWRRFFEWVEKSDFLTGRAQPAQGRAPFVADLEWLLRPTNFAKVIEGKYHQ